MAYRGEKFDTNFPLRHGNFCRYNRSAPKKWHYAQKMKKSELSQFIQVLRIEGLNC